MLGKIPTLLLRLSLIMHSLHVAFEYVMVIDISKRFKLNPQSDEDIVEYNSSNNQTEITGESVIRAYKLLEFFNKNKLLLAGYDIDVELNIEEIFNILVSAQTEIQFTHNKETKVVCL